MPLNESLYRSLTSRFANAGGVLIANAGERALLGSPNRQGQRQIIHAGEYYRVCCPVCGDTQHKLWINHIWGQRDACGDDHIYAMHCYRDQGCWPDLASRKKFYDWLFPFAFGYRPPSQQPEPYTPPTQPVAPASLPEIHRPSSWIPLSDPRAAHAADYLRHRGYDPADLERQWGVQYCVEDRTSKPAIYDRIIIPVEAPDPPKLGDRWSRTRRLVGWQARYIGDPPPKGPPKYLFPQGFRKSELLYGLANIAQYPTYAGQVIVLVEGITDCWRMGQHVVASMGKSLSATQQLLLARHCAAADLVVFYDSGATVAAHNAARQIRDIRVRLQDGGRVVVAVPPPGRNDPGECTPDEAWDAAYLALGRPRPRPPSRPITLAHRAPSRRRL